MMGRIRRGYVYELVCPLKDEPVYIGSTVDPYFRYLHHKSMVKSSDWAMYSYFRSSGQVPIMNLIDEIKFRWDDRRLRDAEYFWIYGYKQMGYHLFNYSGKLKVENSYNSKYFKE